MDCARRLHVYIICHKGYVRLFKVDKTRESYRCRLILNSHKCKAVGRLRLFFDKRIDLRYIAEMLAHHLEVVLFIARKQLSD